MILSILKSKIHCATVTEANLHYMGSITIDEALLEATDLLPGEHVHVVNNMNGERIETYVISGPRGSGCICLNGAAARLFQPGDQVIILNKVRITAEILDRLPRLRLILVAATGYDVVDVAAARERGVTVCNVPAYGTLAVAQHTLALLLEVTNRVGHYAQLNREGYWARSRDFSLWDEAVEELSGVRVSLIGMGNIGRKVAELLRVLEAEVCAVTSQDESTLPTGVRKITLDEAFATSRIVSLHCPLTEQNRSFVNASLLERAAPGLILVNTARGALIDDIAVAEALQSGRLGAYACDVLSTEPPAADHPILSAPNTFVTPHIAWATAAARGRIVRIMAENLKAFLADTPQNVVS